MPSTEKTLLWLQAFRHRPDVAPFFLVLYGEGFHIWIASEFLEEVSADARCWAPWSDTDLVGRSEVGFRLSFQHASPAFSYAVMCGNVSQHWIRYFSTVALIELLLCLKFQGRVWGRERKELHKLLHFVISLSRKQDSEPASGTELKIH